mmetsp:Transcript_12317/g.28067  ORF Transcript_12317/g.28067 Transcript_12317/m.28067 type:complete len:232 (-) Transcript_12317:91-786(-)
MGCCSKWGVFVFTVLFGLGVIISTTAPNWIGFHANDRDDQSLSHEVNYGPFYGRSRECRDGTCGRWTFRAINPQDCTEVQSDLESLCKQMDTFRGAGITCLTLTMIGGALVLAATCCQVLTCGCCGNSLTCVSNVLFGLETMLSVVAWSFAIATQQTIKSGPNVTESFYQWGFWLFLASGTILGGFTTMLADWAADDSCFRAIWHIILCKRCRKKDDRDDRGEPLIQDEYA